MTVWQRTLESMLPDELLAPDAITARAPRQTDAQRRGKLRMTVGELHSEKVKLPGAEIMARYPPKEPEREIIPGGKFPEDMARMQPFRNEHPCGPLFRAKPFMGYEPSCYVALRALREQGRMPQTEFMEVYHRAGGRQGSAFMMNFRRYVWNSYTGKKLREYEEALRGEGPMMSQTHRPSRNECLREIAMRTLDAHMERIRVIRSRYENHPDGRTVTVRDGGREYTRPVMVCVDPSGAPRNGNMLEWVVLSGEETPDWRPEHMIPEDLYAG